MNRLWLLTRMVGVIAVAGPVGAPSGASAQRARFQGTAIALEHRGEAMASLTMMDAPGHVTMPVRLEARSDRIWVSVIERSGIRVPVIMTMAAGGQSVVSRPILPGRGAGGYVRDRSGHRLFLTLTGRRGEFRQVEITLTEAPDAGAH